MVNKHFARCAGETVELSRPDWMPGQYIPFDDNRWLLILTLDGIDSRSVAKKCRNANLFAIGTCPNCGLRHFAERVIARPARPSNHKCDGRCLNAKGHNCECSCGGKHHGEGN